MFWSKSVVAAIVATSLGWHYDFFNSLGEPELRSVSSVIAQIGASMLGFILAALSVLTAVANTRLLRNMMRTGHYGVLLQRMYGCIVALGVVTVFALGFLFMPTINNFLAYPLAGLGILSTILVSDMLQKFWMVLSHLRPDSSS